MNVSNVFGGECVYNKKDSKPSSSQPRGHPGSIQSAGLNASVMKPKKAVAGTSTEQDEEDDPAGLIPRAPDQTYQLPSHLREVSIPAGQFPDDDDEPRFADSGTSYEPP